MEISNNEEKKTEEKREINEDETETGSGWINHVDIDACTLQYPCGRSDCIRDICKYLNDTNPLNRMLIEEKGMTLDGMFFLPFWVRY